MTRCTLWPASIGSVGTLFPWGEVPTWSLHLFFHRVPVNIKALRRQMKAEQVELLDSSEDESDVDDEEEEAQLTMSVEISCSLWALDLLTWNWTR